jgi:hypothetical protein
MFTMRQNRLTLGDISLAFGLQLVGQPSQTSWMIGEFRAVAWLDHGRFSYFQPVHHLYVYRPSRESTWD